MAIDSRQIRKSFKFKLILSYILIVVLSLSLAAFLLDRNLEKNSLREIKSSLINQASLIEAQFNIDAFKRGDLSYLDALARNLSAKIQSRITLINNRGRVLVDSQEPLGEVPAMESHLGRLEVKAALEGNIGTDIHRSSVLKKDMLYVAVPIKDKGVVMGALRIALPLDSVDRMLSTTRRTIFLALIFALVFAFFLGSLIASGVTRPINRIISVSRKYSQGEFSRRILHDSKDEIGELAATLNKMAEDIEEKIREIKSQNQQIGAVFNSMIEGVIVADRSSRIVSINPAVEKIFQVSLKDTQGKLFLEAIRNNDISEVINNVLEKGDSVSQEISLVWPVEKVFQINASPIFRKDAVDGCLIVIHDITEIRRLETMRRDFVANVSHELKTPLTAIKGFVETLLGGALDDKEHSGHFLKIIQEHADRLNNLIEDLLSLSAIESRQIKQEIIEVNLKELTDKVLLGLESQCNKKAIKPVNDLPKHLLVKADKDKIEQVLTNLIDNAIKFNQQKGLVKIYSQDLDDKIKVIVEDSGSGIPPKDIPRIFERFYRVDKARSRELGGTGLGLSIVKHIVELHKGSVGVESTEGLGSKFFFISPSNK